MPDPFEALRAPAVVVPPDPVFAARLRARIERALTLPKGVIVSSITVDLQPEPMTSPAIKALVPYLAVDDARAAVDWYVEAFGARLRSELIVMSDGRIGHAEMIFGDAVLMLADQYPEIGHIAPSSAGSNVTLHLTVDDVDAVAARAVEAGAALDRPPADSDYSRGATVRDPFGHRWILMSETSTILRHGDIAYASLLVPDVDRAAAFFGAVLGWQYAPGSAPQGRQVEGVAPRHGLWGGQPRGTLLLCFAVDDLRAALDRVGAAGGQAERPIEEPYGLVANCVDDQGMAFSLWELQPGQAGPRAGASGWHQGELTYVTLHVVDSARFRAFYRRVLGWQFSPGRVPDGWGTGDVSPMAGLQGGHDQFTVVPMYVVDDIAGAVQRVRAAAGSATDPERQPYGISAECTDDQGTPFYLVQY